MINYKKNFDFFLLNEYINSHNHVAFIEIFIYVKHSDWPNDRFSNICCAFKIPLIFFPG